MSASEWLLLAATATLAAATILTWRAAAQNPDTCAVCGATHPQPPKKGVPWDPQTRENAHKTDVFEEKDV